MIRRTKRRKARRRREAINPGTRYTIARKFRPLVEEVQTVDGVRVDIAFLSLPLMKGGAT